KKLIQNTRERLDEEKSASEDTQKSWKEKIQSAKAWNNIGRQYLMEWNMVWKDVTIGFTIAGVVAIFVPSSFFEALFIGAGQNGYSFLQIIEHIIIGPVVAFFTFIGSMGNIALAAVLYENGVSFAGVMAFIFSDLVVFPVLRINSKYYGWKMSLYILLTLFFSLIFTSIILYYGFNIVGYLPQETSQGFSNQDHFSINYTFYLNVIFLLITAVLIWLNFRSKKDEKSHHHEEDHKNRLEVILKYLAFASY